MVSDVVNYTRQTKFFNPEESNINVTIIGAGSTGSFLAFILAKMGIQKIKVIDFDKVEAHNLPNQYFRISDIGKFKVDALKEIIKDFSGVEIEALNLKIDKDYSFDLDMDTIVISCVDNIETRKLFGEQLNGFPIRLIDTRFGGEGYSIHSFDMGEEEEVKNYLESLEGEIKETSCGEKSIIYTINSLASEVCKMVQRIQVKEENPVLLRREMKKYRFLEQNKEVK